MLDSIMMVTATVAPSGHGWWMCSLPDTPVWGEGRGCDEAIKDMIGALREYAGDWDQLPGAPDRVVLSPLVLFIQESSDDQLRQWLLACAREPWQAIS